MVNGEKLGTYGTHDYTVVSLKVTMDVTRSPDKSRRTHSTHKSHSTYAAPVQKLLPSGLVCLNDSTRLADPTEAGT